MAIIQRNPAPGLIVLSDQSAQYANAEHRALLTRHGLVGSVSRKGDLKMERVLQRDDANYAEVINDIADLIVGF